MLKLWFASAAGRGRRVVEAFPPSMGNGACFGLWCDKRNFGNTGGESYLNRQECFERGADRLVYIGTPIKQLLFGCKQRSDWLPVGLTNYMLDLLS